MGVLDALRTGRRGTELYECRNCGRKLDADSDECPHCGSSEVAYYVF
ncbi:hypothetical protein C491_13017 [Natronococcus amylolyticus DSM 10524]|uniref:Zinc-ribbon domain-containing protein n=1 Tax=Natronococcus amylolyticus DSM 10524 TaxID=1227497 RepID=L9X4T0_9EURY|nr:hypothetical protein C491_13017 [Natronococcus amylolyticus DSM 10524]